LKRESTANQALGQEVFNLFCRDMDDNFREMGMGDLAVPKQMRKVGEAFYGRAQAYESALANGEAALTDALARNVFGAQSAGAGRLANYVLEAVRQLERQDQFVTGKLAFPAADAIAAPYSEERRQA